MIRGQRKCINVQLVQNASIPWEIQQPPLSNSDTASNKNTRQSDSLLLPLDDIRVWPVRKGFFDVNGGVCFLPTLGPWSGSWHDGSGEAAHARHFHQYGIS